MKRSSTYFALFPFALCVTVFAQTPTAQSSGSTTAQPIEAPASVASEAGLSDVRIVRLSQVRGKVQIDRHIGRSYEDAFANIPITGGARLRTDVGLAEVEFEDNSTLRLTPDTEVEFTLLKRRTTGSTISAMKVLHGMVYASLAKTKDNTFTVSAGDATVALNPGSHIRLLVNGLNSNLAVLDGTVQFTDPSSTTMIARNKSMDFDVANSKPPTPAKLQETAFDQWDKNGVDYQKQYSSLRSAPGVSSLYGSSDLNYYGGFVDMPGCGSLWRPYFTSAAWSPFDNGMWAWYPNVGYSWVSPYPWGWLPYHSGSWVSCGGAGWGWRPGGSWVGLQNLAVLAPAGANSRLLTKAPRAPLAGRPAIVPVNARPLSVSGVSGPGTFTVRKDSAGLGVPRETFGGLRHVSSDVERHGQANTEVQRMMIGPPPPNGIRNVNGDSQLSGRQATQGSRSIDTFNRPSVDRANETTNSPGNWSGTMRGSESVNAPMSHQSAPASPPPSNSNSGASHK